MIELTAIRQALLDNELVRAEKVDKLDVVTMRADKKDDYFGTSVKRYYELTTDKKRDVKRWGTEGVIYLNLRDIDDDAMLLRVVAEEASHLISDESKKEVLFQYLIAYFKVKIKEIVV